MKHALMEARLRFYWIGIAGIEETMLVLVGL